jgi:hypothetical protein
MGGRNFDENTKAPIKSWLVVATVVFMFATVYVTQTFAVDKIKSLELTIYEINTRLSNIEGMLKEMRQER